MRFFAARKIAVFFLVVFLGLFFFNNVPVHAQGVSAQGWVQDAEVTTVGKAAARSKDLLNWTLEKDNAQWAFTGGDRSVEQISRFWSVIRNISYALTVIVAFFMAVFIIITRGKSFNPKKQLLILGGIFVLITFSFAFIQGIYQLVDTLQNFFLNKPDGTGFINASDLLNIAFNYKDFIGYRFVGPENDESAKVSLFLVKATTVTYYVMAAVLLVRKIILWFFIILSPLWVLLLPFPLIRNTAKIWLGEFFRWVFYGPLFAVLLAGLVQIWSLSKIGNNGNIPLNFNTVSHTLPNYPTAISILLGGPGETVGMTNSVNNIDAYAKYVFSLFMLWVVIILPFILLKIFRDIFSALLKNDNAFLQQALGRLSPILGRPPPPPPAPVPNPSFTPPGGAGLTQELALHRATTIGSARDITINAQSANIEALPQIKTADILKYAGLSIPKIQDLARMEMQKSSRVQNQMLLRNIASPTSVSSMTQRSRFSSMQQELLSRSRKGDAAATTILAAAESARTGQVAPVMFGNRQAVGAKPGVNAGENKPQLMPTTNHVQTVGLDDYEEVKKMWEGNYRSGDVPISENVKSRDEWLKKDIEKIESVIELISSNQEQQKKQGLEELASILPFLLLGGFSQQETVVYLKAKLEAAKKVLTDLEDKSKEGESEKVMVDNKKEEEASEEMHAEIPGEEENTNKPLDAKEKA